MQLHYLELEPGDTAVVLESAAAWRVEMYILRNCDETFSLIGLSGTYGQSPHKCKLQGPFQSAAQARAAVAAIAAGLCDTGFSARPTAQPQWRLNAQRELRQLQAMRAHAPEVDAFDPKDVFPSWHKPPSQ